MRSPTVRVPALLLVLVALLLAPLAGRTTVAQNGDGKVLRVHWLGPLPHLDPQLAYGEEIYVVSLNYEGLTRFDEQLNPVPAAAESWEFNPDGTLLTFRLRENLTYSDGTPLTAERFRAAAGRTCDPRTAAPYQQILFDVVGCQAFAAVDPADDAAFEAARAGLGITAPDDRTLQIQLTQPAPYFIAIASTWVFFPAKQELIEQGGEGWWLDPALQVGNGPFQLAEIAPDQLIGLRANERYWAGRPKLDGMDLVVVPDFEIAREAYAAGDLDVVRILEGEPPVGAREVEYPFAQTWMLSFNLAAEPFTDQKVREAFAYAIDRETYCAVISPCLPALSWIAPGVPGSVETDAYAYDQEKARQALAESSYGGPSGLPEITYSYFAWAQTDAEWIAGQYRDVLGVTLELEPLDPAILTSLKADPATFPQLTVDGWFQDYPDPQNWLSLYWTCGATLHAGPAGYCNPAFDRLIEQADVELDPAKRIALYEEAGRLLVADAPAVFWVHDVYRFAIRPEVIGYATTASDAFPGQRASLLTLDLAR